MRRLTPFRLLLTLFVLTGTLVLFIVLRRVAGGETNWSPPNPFQDPSTLVLTKDEVARIWEWEVISGHHPSIKPGEQADLLRLNVR